MEWLVKSRLVRGKREARFVVGIDWLNGEGGMSAKALGICVDRSPVTSSSRNSTLDACRWERHQEFESTQTSSISSPRRRASGEARHNATPSNKTNRQARHRRREMLEGGMHATIIRLS
jgi:hypothetical protein